MEQWLSETIGWYGTVAILTAYGGVVFGFLAPHSVFYQVLNVSGALAICFIAWRKHAYEPAALHAVWALIGLIALAGLFL